jgi:hypothetical protein
MNKEIIFCVEAFCSQNAERQAELNECLAWNIGIPEIDRALIFSESAEFIPQSTKVEFILNQGRVTFSDFLLAAVDPEAVYVFANSDIKFTSGLNWLNYLPPDELWALTRWEQNGRLWPGGRESQDAWAIRGGLWPASLLDSCNIQLGWPGCENALAGRLHEYGYKVKNYCHDIRCLHVHANTQRSYSEADRIPRPYYFPNPERLPWRYRFMELFRKAFSYR